jgi:membrane protease YdiL (CAAX protease family)
MWIAAELAALLLQALVSSLSRSPAVIVLSGYFTSAIALLAVTGYWLRARGVGRPWGRGVPAAWVVGGILAGVVLRLVGALVTVLEQAVLPRIVPNNPVVTSPRLFRDPLSVALLVVAAVVLAPLAEEVFYRGVVFGWLRGRLGLAAAAALSGLLFGAAHFDLTLLLPLAAVGAGLAVLYDRARSIWPCYLAHACLNAISLALALLALR